jgi:hypothetical protein
MESMSASSSVRACVCIGPVCAILCKILRRLTGSARRVSCGCIILHLWGQFLRNVNAVILSLFGRMTLSVDFPSACVNTLLVLNAISRPSFFYVWLCMILAMICFNQIRIGLAPSFLLRLVTYEQFFWR